ncbi:MAG: hypothetical protein HKN12_09765 [Gemmatimonadetes bacterium]|nr:hypothetical protein [Gemmatimonadota bacterium]
MTIAAQPKSVARRAPKRSEVVGMADLIQEEGVMIRDEESEVLQKDRANSTYELLLKKAVEEGRIGGPSRCRVCGMRYNDTTEAENCCEKVLQHNRL